MNGPTIPAPLDNPIVVKHARSRLRLQSLIAGLVVLVVLCICLMWAGSMLDWFLFGRAFGYLFALQVIVLVMMGAAQVGQSISSARASGILDFHRVSPLSPAALTFGFFLGAPIREYLFFAVTLPFSLFCLAMGPPGVFGLLQLLVVLLASAWSAHAIALMSGLLVKKPRATNQGAIGFVVFAILMGGSLFGATGYLAGFLEESPRWPFFGVELPWLAVALLYELPALVFPLIASYRRMASERAHVFSKPQAVACLAALAVLLAGGFWGRDDVDGPAVTLGVLYALAAFAILLAGAITPTAAEYAKGLRRAEKRGEARVGVWDDLGLNRVALAALCAVVLAGASVVRSVLENARPPWVYRNESDLSLPIAIGVLTVAGTALAIQYFQLAFPRRGTLFFGLYLFLAWALPVILGSVLLASGTNPPETNVPGQVLFSLSPVTGIVTSSGLPNSRLIPAARAAAILPALVSLFVFNNLVTRERRKIERQVRESAAKPAPLDVTEAGLGPPGGAPVLTVTD